MSGETKIKSIADIVSALKKKDEVVNNNNNNNYENIFITPSSPLSEEPEELGPEPTPPPTRPHHATQASYNWFNDQSQPKSQQHPPHHQHHQQQNDDSSSSSSSTSNINNTYFSNKDSHEFRGPFTAEDEARGNKLFKLEEEQDKIKKMTSKRSLNNLNRIGEDEEESISPTTPSPLIKGKGKSKANDNEWEDEIPSPNPNSNERFSLNNRAKSFSFSSSPSTPNRKSVTGSVGGLQWGLISRKQSHSGLVTPEGEESTSGRAASFKSEKNRRPHPVKRATTQGWGAIRNRLRGSLTSGSLGTEKIARTLSGHELINVSLFTFFYLFLFWSISCLSTFVSLSRN